MYATTAIHALKYMGRIFRQGGLELDEFDVMLRGWMFVLPQRGVLELEMLPLPPLMCPWSSLG